MYESYFHISHFSLLLYYKTTSRAQSTQKLPRKASSGLPKSGKMATAKEDL